MKSATKKIIAGIIGAGAVAGGAITMSDKIDCDYEFEFNNETVCLTEAQKQIIESQLPVSKGFGGVKFGGK